MEVFERIPKWLSERFVDRRLEERLAVLVTAELQIGTIAIKGVLLNLSRRGAMMAATEAVASGTCAELRLEGTTLPVTVTWAEGRRFGLMFGRLLSRATVDAIAAASTSTSRAR